MRWCSQSCKAKAGELNLLDTSSRRSVCLSSYAAETLGAAEGLDAGELLRGCDCGGERHFGGLEGRITEVPPGVTDRDQLSKDTGPGAQKSLAFTLASLRRQLRRPNKAFRWTATANLFVDAGTKDMGASQMKKVLRTNWWSVEVSQQFVKQSGLRPRRTSW